MYLFLDEVKPASIKCLLHIVSSSLSQLESEIDISVSKLLGVETFANFLRVLVSVSENLVSEKSLGFGFEKIWSRKKVSVSVSENLVSENKKSK